ncbi:hypothetical protein QTP88_015751 [Uroleucon formosanum]
MPWRKVFRDSLEETRLNGGDGEWVYATTAVPQTGNYSVFKFCKYSNLFGHPIGTPLQVPYPDHVPST